MYMYDYTSGNSITSASDPLTLEAYSTYFLIPHIMASLIAEDKNETLEGGWEAMQRSRDHGRTLNGHTDDNDIELDAIFAKNAKARKNKNKNIEDEPKPSSAETLRPGPQPSRSRPAPSAVKVSVSVSLFAFLNSLMGRQMLWSRLPKNLLH